MSVLRPALLAGALLAALPAFAQSPAETPPASFAGTQYVDSRGCVFVRSIINGQTRWLARLDSRRQPLCGREPTFARASQGKGAKGGAAGRPAGGKPSARAPARRLAAASAAPGPDAANRSLTAYPIPRGFRAAWSDGRLNPLRGPRTAEGDAMMLRIWTDTVPRRLRQRP